MRRACKPPVIGRDVAPTSLAVQQDLPLVGADVGARLAGDSEKHLQQPRPDSSLTAAAALRPQGGLPQPVRRAPTERLWFCVWLPHLPLEANRSSDGATAVVEEQHGIHRILLADAEARAAGVMPGQAANAALALLPALKLEERSLLREQQALEGLTTWLERFSSFVAIADHNVLLLEIAGSLRLFNGLQ